MRAALLALLLSLPSAAAAEDGAPCLACHGAGDRPAVEPAAFAASVHGTLPCTTCHEDAATVPHPARPQRPGLATCGACHGELVAGYSEGVHGRASARGAAEAAACADCHGAVHALRPHADAGSPAHWSHVAATCARCHADREIVEKFRIPVVRPVEAYLASAHARAVAAGRRSAVCSDCHDPHRTLAGSDPRSSIWRTNVPDTCGRCHADVLAAYRESVHGEAMARGVRAAPVCTDCHGEHRILGARDPASPVFAANIPLETCGRCHGDERLSAKYGLDHEKVKAFGDSYHGLALRAGRLTVANCATCHGVHDIRPSGDPRSRVHPANLPLTCGKCHPGAGTHFTLGPVHVVPERSAAAAAVSWIRYVYLWLIGLTIGGMTLHNAVDLARKARRAQPAPAAGTAAAPERMSRPLRWQHGLVMVSFPVLVYTGFALTYPESWWAAPLLGWESRFGLRGLTHRVAAVVLLVGLLWHVAHVAASPRLRACLRGLRPGRRDLAAVLGAFRGRRAPGGTFSYVEKAEYWAFVWGTAVMALTGFLLWFENAALRYLPKWTTDVATAIHFYEAVLATLAIVVWHLYWVVFDPDVYPMDWSWWDGRSPASRTREREAEAEARPDGASV